MQSKQPAAKTSPAAVSGRRGDGARLAFLEGMRGQVLTCEVMKAGMRLWAAGVERESQRSGHVPVTLHQAKEQSWETYPTHSFFCGPEAKERQTMAERGMACFQGMGRVAQTGS